MLSQLQERILRAEVVDYVLAEYESALLKALGNMVSELGPDAESQARTRGRAREPNARPASGQLSPTIMAAITDREREVSEITECVVSSSEDSIKTRVAAMRTTAKSKLKDLRSLLGGDVTVARTALLNHVDRIQMRADGKVYAAKGNWNFFGHLRVVPGEGSGPNVWTFPSSG
jgi:hypothetical protein